VISILLSYLLLRRLREPAAAAVGQRLEARQRRRAAHPDEDELFEDAVVDAEQGPIDESTPGTELPTDAGGNGRRARDGERQA
jgi:hypothetical protein